MGTSAPDLQALIGRRHPVAVCLQETKLAPDATFGMRGYSVYRKDQRNETIAHGGVLLAIRHSIPSQQVTLQTSLQAVAARVHLNNNVVTLCSLYLPPGIVFPRNELICLLTELPPPVVVLGDFNAHHVVWGCRDCCSRGRTLERLIHEEQLCVLNTGTRTHFTTPTGQTSVLDLSLCSPQLAHLFSWTVDDDPAGSDHFPVWLKYQDRATLSSRPQRWNLRKANWSDFNTRMEELVASPADSMESFTSKILYSATETIPRTTGMPRRPPVPWWTDECKEAIRARRRAFRVFDRMSTAENLVAFRKARARARRTIKEAKRISWMKYVSQLNRFTPTSQVWSQIKRISGKFSSAPLPVLTIGNQTVLAPLDVANKIGHAFAERCSMSNAAPEFLQHKARCESSLLDFSTTVPQPLDKPFTMAELKSAINTLRSVAEGPDQIHNEMIRRLPAIALANLLVLFNNIWESGEFPAAWREAVVIPLLKPGKDGSDPLHYRPISLTSCLCKLMEKLVNLRLSWFLEQRNILTNAQCGFRKNRSTVDHLVTFDTVVRTAFKQRHHVGAIFFDLEAAYDTTWRHGILMKAHRHGIRGHMGLFLQNFMRERVFRVRVGNQLSDQFYQQNGVPQGGVLSVALFTLMINDVVDVLPRSVGRSLFVDDLAIWYTSPSTRSLERQLQMAVGRLERWALTNGFRFSTEKSVAAHFCRRRACSANVSVTLCGRALPVRTPVRFLGLELDRKLTYKEHFNMLRTKCFKALNILKCAARTSYGADRKTLLTLYRSLIRSKLDYACMVYDGACASSKRSLDTIHHTAVRIATGAFRTSPTASILIEADEMPLALRRKALCMRYVIKLLQFPDHPTYRAIFSKHTLDQLRKGGPERTSAISVRFSLFLQQSGIRTGHVKRYRPSASPPWDRVLPIIDTSLSAVPKGQLSLEELHWRALEMVNLYSDYVAIYTDGSKSSHGVGSAFVCGNTVRTRSLPSCASIFTAELVAIRSALNFIDGTDAPRHVIFSDSLSSLIALTAFNSSNAFVHDILTSLISLHQSGKEVVLCWIPGHVGVTGNEKADLAARSAAAVQPNHIFPLPATDFTFTISQCIRKEWQRSWDAAGDNKLKAVKPQTGVWQSSYRKSRYEEVSLCRLRIGHTYATHKFLLCGDERPLCPRCGEYLTVRHVLESCQRLQSDRVRFFGSSDIRLKDILDDHSDHIRDVLHFLTYLRFLIIFSPGA